MPTRRWLVAVCWFDRSGTGVSGDSKIKLAILRGLTQDTFRRSGDAVGEQ